MANWTSSMEQTFEYYKIDPNTWKDVEKINNITSSSISRDSEVETLGSATIDITDSIGECYTRIYLVTNQNGITERHPLGTVLVQTPASSFNGRVRTVSMDTYTPLLELKENLPPIGYYLPKGENIMDAAYRIAREYLRAPVVKAESDAVLEYDFVADPSETWLSFLTDLIANARHTFGLDERGRVLFLPIQDTASLQPVWTYNDDNSSILYPELNMDHDLYGIPNVVEVTYSSGAEYFHVRVVNDDPNSPISTVNRGREIVHRVNNPELSFNLQMQTVRYKVEYDPVTTTYTKTDEIIELPEYVEFDTAMPGVYTDTLDLVYATRAPINGGGPLPIDRFNYYCVIRESLQLKEYAIQLLKELSTLEYTISYTHGYCPVRLGDCVRLNYKAAGLENVKAKVIRQEIKCQPGCPVSETVVFTKKLWR